MSAVFNLIASSRRDFVEGLRGVLSMGEREAMCPDFIFFGKSAKGAANFCGMIRRTLKSAPPQPMITKSVTLRPR